MTSGGPAGVSAALELIGVSKHFGTIAALDGVDLTVRRGSVHALLGENGAGKSTLMRIAFGLESSDAGALRLFGDRVMDHSVRAAARAGVGMVHQHLSLVPILTAAENLVLGGRGLFREREAAALLERTAAASGLRVPHDVLARDLTVVEQQRLEILKALAFGARLLILDEPTSGLAPIEVDELLNWIRSFAASGGSVVLVTHKLREAVAVADEVTVLRRGRVSYAGPVRDTTESQLALAIFPELARAFARAGPTRGEVVVEARDLVADGARARSRVSTAAFELHRGEIVGIAAIEGSGHRELLAALAGLRTPSAGHLRLPARIALIPADRAREAMVPDFTLAENVALRDLGTRTGRMPWQAITRQTAALMERFGIAAPSPSARARTLSGGNQQRLVVARELDGPVDLIVADNPTRGLDLRATAFVHDQLRLAAEGGASVVFHSSDLDELLSIATRVLVVYHGQVAEAALDRESVGRAMIGAAPVTP